MRLDLEKIDRKRKYLFIDENDEADLSNFNEDDKFFILDNETNQLRNIKKYEFKQLYTQSKEELKKELSGIVELNTEYAKEEILEFINELLNKKINEKLAELNIIHFAGEVNELPISSSVGQVFILNSENKQSYYICTEQNKLQRILLESDISDYFLLNEYQSEILGLKSFFNDKINGFQSYYEETYFTKDEIRSQLSSTLEEINYLSGIISGFIQ